MSRKDEKRSKLPDVPWITKDGYLDLNKFPIDSVLELAVSDDVEKIGSACRLLSSMACGGRTEAGIFLYGLLKYCGDDRVKKESVVEALGSVKTRASADLLFDELNKTESSNATRGYIKKILKALGRFPLELVIDGFDALLSDPKWSYRMKQKFEALLEAIECRGMERI